jgi:hypothetical protein
MPPVRRRSLRTGDSAEERFLREYGLSLRSFEGLSVTAANDLAAEHGVTIRVLRRDGELLSRREDLRGNRVNVDVRDGFVVGILGVY